MSIIPQRLSKNSDSAQKVGLWPGGVVDVPGRAESDSQDISIIRKACQHVDENMFEEEEYSQLSWTRPRLKYRTTNPTRRGDVFATFAFSCVGFCCARWTTNSMLK